MNFKGTVTTLTVSSKVFLTSLFLSSLHEGDLSRPKKKKTFYVVSHKIHFVYVNMTFPAVFSVQF